MTERGSQALAGFRRVCQIGEQCASLLDGPAAMMSASAWAGEGAAQFADDLTGRRRDLQAALQAAAEVAADRVAAHGGRRPAVPALTEPMRAVTSGGPAIVMSAELVRQIVTALRSAAATLRPASPALSGLLVGLGAGTGPAQVLESQASWAAGAAGRLAQKLEILHHLNHAGKKLNHAGTGLPPWILGPFVFGVVPATARTTETAGATAEEIAAVLASAGTGDPAAFSRLVAIQKQFVPGLAERVNALWSKPPEKLRQRLMAEDPAAIGALDGLRATVRDEANRICLNAAEALLTKARAELERVLAQHPTGLLGGISRIPFLGSLAMDAEEVPVLGTLIKDGADGLNSVINDLDGVGGTQAQLALVNDMLNGIAAIKTTIGRPGQGHDGMPPAYLLGFDTANPRGHAIVSIGNPDAAQNVATIVQGANSGLTEIKSVIAEKGKRLWRKAYLFAPRARTAVICFAGYNAPQQPAIPTLPGLIQELRSIRQLTSLGLAKKAAPLLDGFQAGLSAAHTSKPARSLVVGYSYGSPITGLAAARTHRLATNLAFLGAGSGVDQASQLGVPKEHVFGLAAGNDPVMMSGLFGSSPESPGFGGRSLEAGSGAPITTSHFAYWDMTSPALANLAHLAVGQYDMLTYSSQREIGRHSGSAG